MESLHVLSDGSRGCERDPPRSAGLPTARLSRPSRRRLRLSTAGGTTTPTSSASVQTPCAPDPGSVKTDAGSSPEEAKVGYTTPEPRAGQGSEKNDEEHLEGFSTAGLPASEAAGTSPPLPTLLTPALLPGQAEAKSGRLATAAERHRHWAGIDSRRGPEEEAVEMVQESVRTRNANHPRKPVASVVPGCRTPVARGDRTRILDETSSKAGPMSSSRIGRRGAAAASVEHRVTTARKIGQEYPRRESDASRGALGGQPEGYNNCPFSDGDADVSLERDDRFCGSKLRHVWASGISGERSWSAGGTGVSDSFDLRADSPPSVLPPTAREPSQRGSIMPTARARRGSSGGVSRSTKNRALGGSGVDNRVSDEACGPQGEVSSYRVIDSGIRVRDAIGLEMGIIGGVGSSGRLTRATTSDGSSQKG